MYVAAAPAAAAPRAAVPIPTPCAPDEFSGDTALPEKDCPCAELERFVGGFGEVVGDGEKL
jgi:hypothetical protein